MIDFVFQHVYIVRPFQVTAPVACFISGNASEAYSSIFKSKRVMGRKGRKCVRSPKAVSRENFSIGALAARRREIREEYISISSIYNAERKRLKWLKEKVVKGLLVG